MNQKDDEMEASTREKMREAAQSSIVQLIIPGIMTVSTFFLGYAVNRLSDHFDRIDAHLAASDTSGTVLRRDVDEIQREMARLTPLRESQIKEIRDQGLQNKWDIDALRVHR